MCICVHVYFLLYLRSNRPTPPGHGHGSVIVLLSHPLPGARGWEHGTRDIYIYIYHISRISPSIPEFSQDSYGSWTAMTEASWNVAGTGTEDLLGEQNTLADWFILLALLLPDFLG